MRFFAAIAVTTVAASSPACPSGGWDDFFPAPEGSGSPSKCFQKMSTPMSWWQCRAACSDAGGAQLCIRSDAESVFIRDYLEMSRRCCYWHDKSCCTWIGYHQSNSTGESGEGWSWDRPQASLNAGIDACSSSYTSWAPGEPNDYQGANENCALMMPGGDDTAHVAGSGHSGAWGRQALPYWNDQVCTAPTTCVCEVKAEDVPAPPPPPPSPPPPPLPSAPPHNCGPITADGGGWWPPITENGVLRPHNGAKCYKVLNGTHSKPECDALCQELGGGGVCISSMEENDGVFSGANIHPRCCNGLDRTCCAWLGIHQSNGNRGSKYHWDEWALTSEGSRCHSAFRNWAYGEPNDADGVDEDCAVMGFQGYANAASPTRALPGGVLCSRVVEPVCAAGVVTGSMCIARTPARRACVSSTHTTASTAPRPPALEPHRQAAAAAWAPAAYLCSSSCLALASRWVAIFVAAPSAFHHRSHPRSSCHAARARACSRRRARPPHSPATTRARRIRRRSPSLRARRRSGRLCVCTVDQGPE